MLSISKKLRFIISSILLSAGFVLIQFLPGQFKFPSIAILVLVTCLFSVWSFYEGLDKNMTLVSLVLPMLFTLSVGIFWFLLPVNIFTRIPIVIFFAVGIYALFSTMNIYTVSSSLRTIALLHAAKGVGFVLTLVTSFLIFDAILSIKQMFYVNFALVLIASFLMFFQGYWSVELEKKINKEIFLMSLISSLVIGELSILIFFWPVTVVVGSLFLTSGVYVLLGLGQAKFEDRLFPSTIREYLTVGSIVFLSMFFATRWGN
jgi:hypothetical protein